MRSTRPPAVRRAVLGLGSVLLAGCAVAACTQPPATATDGGTVAPATAPVPSATSTTGGRSTPTGTTTSSARSTSAPASTAFPTTFVDVDARITDTGLGHRVTVSRLLRGLPWPAGYTASAQAYELVAVEMTWTPSTDYTAPLRQQDFSLATGSQYPNRPEHIDDAQLKAHGLTLLPSEVASGSSAKGWLVFKVDPKGATSIRLDYTRPASQVTGSSQTFSSKVFSAQLVG